MFLGIPYVDTTQMSAIFKSTNSGLSMWACLEFGYEFGCFLCEFSFNKRIKQGPPILKHIVLWMGTLHQLVGGFYGSFIGFHQFRLAGMDLNRPVKSDCIDSPVTRPQPARRLTLSSTIKARDDTYARRPRDLGPTLAFV